MERRAQQDSNLRPLAPEASALSTELCALARDSRVPRGLEAFNRGEWTEVFEDWFHPDIEWSDPPGFPGAGVHRGREERAVALADAGLDPANS